MEYVFKLCFYIFIMTTFVIQGSISYFYIIDILILMIMDILIQKYFNSKIIIFLEGVFIIFLSVYKPFFIVFLGICSYEFLKKESYLGIFFIVPIFVFLDLKEMPIYLLLFIITSFYGYIYNKYSKEQKKHKMLYDNERKVRYELEGARNRLIQSSMEISRLAEVKERNRIAREIHDTVGHNMAGIYMQLQAAGKLRNKNREKSEELIDKSIVELSKSLALLRDTVHNIVPSDSAGIDYIIKIVEEFKFCKVNFKHIGNFNNIDPNIMEIIGTNIKEALTNALKYSMATIINIELQSNEKYIRLYIRDNGIGCNNIKEGLGISGMKERIKNVGGNISIDYKDGFLIVCVIPIEKLGGSIFENIDS